jgi:hypothetical protein
MDRALRKGRSDDLLRRRVCMEEMGEEPVKSKESLRLVELPGGLPRPLDITARPSLRHFQRHGDHAWPV